MIPDPTISSSNKTTSGELTSLHLKIATLLLFFFLLAFRAVSGFTGLYGQDPYEYTRYAGRIFSFITTGTPPGDYFWPVLYPIAGALLNFIIGDIAFSLQLISMLSFCGVFYYLNKIIYFIHHGSRNKILIYCGLLFALSPIVLRSTFFVMSDMFALALLVAAVYYSLKYCQTHSSYHFCAVALLSAAALMTRYPTAIILFVPVGVVLYHFIRNFDWKALVISFFIVSIIFLPHILIRINEPTAFAGHEFVENWSVAYFFKNEMANSSGVFKYRFVNIIHAFFAFVHPGYLFLGIILLPLIRKVDLHITILLFVVAPVLIYTFFIAGMPFQNIRFLLLPFPLILVLFYPAFRRFIGLLSKIRIPIIWVFIFIALLQLILAFRAFAPFYQLNRLERSIATQLQEYPHQKVVSFAMDVSLKYNLKDKEIINLWEVDNNDSLKGALFLLNEEAYLKQLKSTQWETKLHEFKATHHPRQLEELAEGWILYELEK